MKALRTALFMLICATLVPACDTFQPSQLCGDQTEADYQSFVKIFSEMQLVNLDGSYAEDGAEQTGRVFDGPTSLALSLYNEQDTQLRLCIFGTKRNGEIVFDETFTVDAGQESIRLGEFEKGQYIIRVYADELLVENISFMIK
ncbi:MAG: hypothetical protein ISR58_21865 [Anaerolineales bacterium]|nr:hypothetical protein [Chloroflexota bacterium]MBL6983840.1 hypothetical protein [Anaerolineales bacterium]